MFTDKKKNLINLIKQAAQKGTWTDKEVKNILVASQAANVEITPAIIEIMKKIGLLLYYIAESMVKALNSFYEAAAKK